jgi:K(+)-stimulated pyrophosphate-energized sodium pump
MNLILAAEGGYQDFVLKGGEKAILALSGASALIAIAVGFLLMKGVLAQDKGTPKMIEIATAIQEGALAYLKRQFRTIIVVLVPLAVVVFISSKSVVNPVNGNEALSFAQSGLFRTLAFVAGAFLSGLTGYIGMTLATQGNVRTAAAATRNSLPDSLQVAFRTGGVAGMFTVGLGLAGATVIIAIFQNTSSAILVGFGFGGSLLALFLRVGGGIFTKAADVGADLVGKVEAGIPEDDPRNPATIADNVGDNVGDCAGMASDLFESYEVTLVASIILGVPAFQAAGLNPALGLVFPLAARAIGVIASIAGVYAVKAKEGETNALKPINRGFLTAGIITVIGVGALALGYVKNPTHDFVDHAAQVNITNVGWRCFGAVVIGLILAQVVSRLTEYFTATHHGPVKEIARSTRTGPATTILSGTSAGMESSVYAIIAIALAIGVSLALGGGNLQFSLYLVALCGMGMLATTGVIVSEDTFGPVSDNAAGIAEMSGEFHGEPERIMVSLDAVGNTTKAVTKGFAIGSAVIASVAIFASFMETAVNTVITKANGYPNAVETIHHAQDSARGVFDLLPINVADPKVFIGLLIGGAVPFLFSALAINAVSRTAGVVVQEVRRQFADGKIMRGEKEPDHAPVIDICTKASLRELVTPALLAVLTPVIVGFGIGFTALGAFLVAVILVGQLMANYLSNSGGAWDNAKKYIEDGNEGGKGSDSYRAAVIADTVGDPFKDTAGPALNPLIKVMNLVSLLILPAMLGMAKVDAKTSIVTPKGGSVAIAGVALVILIGAIAFSKRPSSGFGTDADFAAAAAATTEVSTVVERELVSVATPAASTATAKKAPARKAPATKATAAKTTAAKKATPVKKAAKKRT